MSELTTRAVGELAGYTDSQLFEAIAEGMPLIVENAERLEAAARTLFETEEHLASGIMKGFAEEEAAKVLVLLDVVRCPEDRRRPTLACFYDHLAKRIYALSCQYEKMAFSELEELVARERAPFYLDGPNDIDWIFENSIIANREGRIYVDYVRDITDGSHMRWWSDPRRERPWVYECPRSVEVGRALCDAGAGSAEGLGVIADTWRGFEADEVTTRGDLHRVIVQMLERLVAAGHCPVNRSLEERIVSGWSFPLWQFELSGRVKGKEVVERLREQRTGMISWIEEREARRDPPPAIERQKVEELHQTYEEWVEECDKEDARRGWGKYSDKLFRSGNELTVHCELPGYKRLEALFEELDEDERAALLALAWFTRDRVADWPRVYEEAKRVAGTTNVDYQIGCAGEWLAGVRRWEEVPRPFEAGRWYRNR